MAGKKDAAESDDKVIASGYPATMVWAIGKALAEADGEGDASRADTTLELGLQEALRLFPKRYLRQFDGDELEGECIQVSIPDLFDQLREGKVELTIGELAYFVPLHLVYRAALKDEQKIVFPLVKVVGQIGLDSFRRRTPVELRHYEIEGLPDPFPRREPPVSGVVAEGAVAGGAVAPEVASGAVVPESGQAVAAQPAEEAAVRAAGSDVAVGAAAVAPIGVVERSEPAVAERSSKCESGVVLERTDEAAGRVEEGAGLVKGGDASVPVAAGGTSGPAPELRVESVEENLADLPVGGEVSCRQSELLAVMPADYFVAEAISKVGRKRVTLELADLYVQLATGRVVVPFSVVAGKVSAELISDQGRVSGPVDVVLPLSLVVGAVGGEELKRRTIKRLRRYDIGLIPDPFPIPRILPRFKHAERQVAGVAPGLDGDGGRAIIEGLLPSSTQVIPQEGGAGESEQECREFPGNVNLNSADTAELLLLEGMTGALAEEVLRYREKKGSFRTVFELLDVPGVDEVSFRKMTGMHTTDRRLHRRKRLSNLLLLPANRVTDLRLVAKRIASKPGFSACMICDLDGQLLADSGLGGISSDLAAVLPRLVGRIRRDMVLAGAGKIDTISMTFEGLVCTVAVSRNAMVVALFDERGVGKTSLDFIRKVCGELSWLLGVRAYVGANV